MQFRETEVQSRVFEGGDSPPCCIIFKEEKGERKGQEEEELYNRLIWKEVKNVSITGLIEFPLALEGSRMDSPSFPLSLSIPFIQLFALARDIISSPFT